MMSSAIPARLLFQCGHAALVTLPRVKGETSAQRNDRVAREKNAALARPCDFCGPAVEVAVQTNGSRLAAADVFAAEPIVVAREPLVDEQPVVAALADETESVVLSVDESAATATLDEPVVFVDESVLVIEEPVVVVEEPVAVVEVVEPAAKRHVTAGRRRRAATSQLPIERQFAVEYRLERVLRAADIRDALRQAQALGATAIHAIERLSD